MSNPHVITTVRCACCGKVKGETNHWFLIVDGGYFFQVTAMYRIPEQNNILPVCGQTCAQAGLEKWMTRKRNAENKAASPQTREA